MYASVLRRFGRYRRRVERLVWRNGFARAQLVMSYFSIRLRKPGIQMRHRRSVLAATGTRRRNPMKSRLFQAAIQDLTAPGIAVQ
jgi:hypothetical protein